MNNTKKISILLYVMIGLVVLLGLVILIMALPRNKYDYDGAYIQIAHNNTHHYNNIKYYYYEDDMVVIVLESGAIIKTSKDNVTFYKTGE